MILDKTILILEDDLLTLSKILDRLARIEHDQSYEFSVITLTNYLQVQHFINDNPAIQVDMILLDRDCKLAGSFHVVDLKRPKEAQTRSKVGHWETDLMEGSKKTHHVVSVTVERRTGAVMMDKVSSKESREKMEVMVSRMERIPIHVRKTITFDNGTENAEHRRLYAVHLDTFFRAPYHSWEKGTVENTIGLVREYYPREQI